MGRKLMRGGGVMIAAIVLMSVVTHAQAASCNYALLQPSLDKAVAETLTDVKSDNSAALLKQMSHLGVAFGSEGELVPYPVLSEMFTKKTGHYCDLFTCKGKVGGLHALFGSGPMSKSIDTKHNRASVTLNANTQKELDLSYVYTPQCTWELTAIGGI